MVQGRELSRSSVPAVNRFNLGGRADMGGEGGGIDPNHTCDLERRELPALRVTIQCVVPDVKQVGALGDRQCGRQ